MYECMNVVPLGLEKNIKKKLLKYQNMTNASFDINGDHLMMQYL